MGYDRVTYTYTAETETYTAHFDDMVWEDGEHLKAGDTLEVRFNPHNPSRSYYPERRTQTKFRLAAAAIGVALAAVSIIAHSLTHSAR